MTESIIPDLTFPFIKYGKFETAWDLRPLLYIGGAGSNTKLVASLISEGAIGTVVTERIPLVIQIHDYIAGKLVGGGRRGSAQTSLRRLREFFMWVDSSGRSLSLNTVETTFIAWTDYLVQRNRITGDISEIHAYQTAVAVAKILNQILELRHGLLAKTRIRRRGWKCPILGPKADKQKLEHAFTFGNALLDITDCTDAKTIRGPIPITIRFRTGQVIEEWLKLKPPQQVKTLRSDQKPSTRHLALSKRARWESDTSNRTRYPLINLRIESELLIFITQTGMNLEQAHCLQLSKFRYQSHLDGYHVYRVYKNRRHGEVAFDIFSQYREHFDRYLAWRAAVFPDDDDLLFPLVKSGRAARPPVFTMVQKYCMKLGIRFIPTRELRKTRINWLLRRSQDPATVAAMHAHTQETLIRHYHQPNIQVAMVEINRFHSRTDPTIVPPGPGACVKAIPDPLPGIPPEASAPDCISPAGCLFCEHQRDIDSDDYVWSLVSFRHLKSLELAKYHPSSKSTLVHPAAAAVDRITDKIKAIAESSKVRELWVLEALTRVEEDDHHPQWDGFIRLLEARI